MVLNHGEGAGLPVGISVSPDTEADPKAINDIEVVLPIQGGPEIASGIWPNGLRQGHVFVANVDVLPTELDSGTVIGEIHKAVAQTRVCTVCGTIDTDGWILAKDMTRCNNCDSVLPEGRQRVGAAKPQKSIVK